ncbi:lactonase family protein [Streptomyces sp. SID13031]|uniref:lactonase family protein n=1 Tax=Streptomyces sp. SID13031 TaxID=2706046 RepID=UPI0013C9DE84|nr:lactonase family protein [Streptomyces sp. SID13031]NEA36211.1 lactonase family protein [Streptomyces sp. SID13031]
MTSEQIYVGSYTSQDGGGDGIGFGTTEELQVVAATADPSFLTISADGRYLYSTNELEAGRVSAFAIADSGALEFLNHQPTGGAGPCHLEVDPSGKFLLSANYGSGSVAIHPIKENGSLGDPTQILQREGTGPNAERQEGPHAHQVTFDPSGSFAFDIDLGSDTVYVSTLSANGRLEEVSRLQIHPGAGPRHLAFHPGGHAAYLINELDSTLTVCSFADGKLAAVETVSTRPDDASGESFPAEVLVSNDGRFVYGSNRGDDTIAVFETGAEGLEAELIQTIGSGGTWPRHLAFSKDGTELYAANERSDSIAVFTVDQSSGALTATGTPLDWPKPVCVLAY